MVQAFSLGVGVLLLLARWAKAQQAQNSQFLPSATQQWNYNPTCTAGLFPQDPNNLNGTIVDTFGATWQVNCQQRSPGTYLPTVDTNGRGMSACFRGCDKVPGCVGFYYLGTEIDATNGTGICRYQRRVLSPYVPDSYTTVGDYRIYASAHSLLASPQLPCPYYNNSRQIDGQGNTWSVFCGYNGPGTDLATIKVDSMNDCYTACNVNAQCNQFVFTYVGSEPASITGSTAGSCALKSGPYPGIGLTYTDTQNFACRISNVTSVTFNVLTTATYGQLPYLAGSISQLGSWQTNSAVQLNSSNYTDYNPQWYATIQIPAGTSFEYKYLRREVDGSFTWDTGSNRAYTVP
ncbi:hypothetical protein AC579_4937 [Pseudocercospora musae]|uniref:CBM20 domain-containing protein n=1 Tax=Pseudocercospora musae TaxID=113226 RepID=A0A139I8T4_9PEZI|nr:hypothetical protein AC579_4937 [Pseudocercospora musae]